MKYLTFILRNLSRNRLRLVLTILSMAFSLAMMTAMYGFLGMWDIIVPQLEKYNRVVTMSVQGISGMLPIAHLDLIRSTPGVRAAVPLLPYDGEFRGKDATFALLATDPKYAFEVWDEYKIDPKEILNWQHDRQGCVVDRLTAEEQGWKIGEHIPIKGTTCPVDLDLTLCGIYEPHEWSVSGVWFHWDYLEQGLVQTDRSRSGQTGMVLMKADSADAIPEICRVIDNHFANSSDPTFTQAAHAFALMFSQALGNIAGYVRNVGLAVIFSLTMAGANTMAISVRERTLEIAVLKAIGYRPRLILTLILGESLIVSVLGGLLGVTAGYGTFSCLHMLFPGMIPLSQMSWQLMLKGLSVAAGIGLLSGLFPALRAAQISVIDGLRRV